MKSYVDRLHLLSVDEYVTKTQEVIDGKGGISANFCSLSAEYSHGVELELRKKASPSIQDIADAYNVLLQPFDGKLILLIDEVSSLHKSFFQSKTDSSMFETLMNQLRTLSFVRTKVAIYPQDHADILPETRYGDAVYLQENIKDTRGYENYLNRTISLIEQYINELTGTNCKAEDLFEIESSQMAVMEQIVNASDGNTRRLVQLLDLSLNMAFNDHNGADRVKLTHVIRALQEHSRTLEQQYSLPDVEFLRTISSTCRARTTFMFRFPNKSINLQRFTQKSAEYNIINLIQPGSGRKGAVYSIDYAYAVYNEVPTHYLKNTERIDKNRSCTTGQWITKITTINDSIIENAQIPGKIEGVIDWLSVNSEKEITGFIKSDDGVQYLYTG